MAKRLFEALTTEERQALVVIGGEHSSLARSSEVVGVSPLTFVKARAGEPLSEPMILVIRARLAARAVRAA